MLIQVFSSFHPCFFLKTLPAVVKLNSVNHVAGDLSSSSFCSFPVLASQELAGNGQCLETWVTVTGMVRVCWKRRSCVLCGGDLLYTAYAFALVPVSVDQCSLWLYLFCIFEPREIHRGKEISQTDLLHFSGHSHFLLEDTLHSFSFFKGFLSMFSEIYRLAW